MFFLFSFLASSLIYGVDIGSDNIRIGSAGKGNQLSLLISPNGKRSFKNILAFHSKENKTKPEEVEWSVGYDTYIPLSKNPKNSVENPYYYLTHPKEFPLENIHPVQAAGIALSLSVPSFIPKTDKYIVAVPSFATPQYRLALQESLSLFANSIELLDQDVAIATCYAVEKINRTHKTTYNIMFVEIGAKHTEVSEWKFGVSNNAISAELIDFRFSDEVSGDAIDKEFLKFTLANMTEKPAENDIKELEKIMKRTKESMNSGANVTINLTQYNVLLNLTNETALEISKPVTDKLVNMIKEFKTPDRIEFVGGASKFIPFVDAARAQYPELDINQTMNPDESIALGTSYYAAIKNKYIYGLKLNITKPNIFGYTVNKGEKSREILASGLDLQKRVLSFLEKDDFKFSLSTTISEKYRSKFVSKEISQMKPEFIDIEINGIRKLANTHKDHLGEEKFFTNITFDGISGFGFFGITNAVTSNKIDGKDKAWTLNFDYELCDKTIESPRDSTKIVQRAISTSKNAKKGILHEIEAIVLDTLCRLKYDSSLYVVTTRRERANLEEYLNEVQNNITEVKTVKAGRALLTALNNKLRAPILRADERLERPIALEGLQIAIDQATEALSRATTDEGTIAKFKEYYDITVIWKEVAREVPLLATPVILCKDIVRRTNTLINRIPELFGPKKKVLHLRTAPPITPTPEPNITNTNSTESTNSTDGQNSTEPINGTETNQEKSESNTIPQQDNNDNKSVHPDSEQQKEAEPKTENKAEKAGEREL